MSCLCCCWRQDSDEARHDENGNFLGHHELVFKVPPEEIENPRASSMQDDHSLGNLVQRQPEIQIIVDSYHEPAVSPAVDAATTMKVRAPVAISDDFVEKQPSTSHESSSEANITKSSIDESEVDNAAGSAVKTEVTKEPSYKPKKSKGNGEHKCTKSKKEHKRPEGAYDTNNGGYVVPLDEMEDCDDDISIGSEAGSTHFFEEIMFYSSGLEMAELKKDFLSMNDSFDKEFKENAAGRSEHKSEYVLYTDKETVSQVRELMLMALCKEREDLLELVPEIVPNVLQCINSERVKHCSDDLCFQAELNEMASVLWHDRARIRDGFVVVPRGVFFPRSGAIRKRYGALVYYTTRATCPQAITGALINFWFHDGVPINNTQEVLKRNVPGDASSAVLTKVTDFPEAKSEDCYVKHETKMGTAFEKYRKYFRYQLLAAQCKAMGLHIDMVRTPDNRNLICVAAIFDFVAHPKGRDMKLPFA